MNKTSAGILLFRHPEETPEVLLAHPGGPFWAKKDEGAWSVPKGEFSGEETALDAAKREFEEETGVVLRGNFIPLGSVKQKSGKTVFGFALEKDLDPAGITCNTVLIEWPPRSGKKMEIPEIDRVEWFTVPAARKKINPAQAAFLDRLLQHLEG